MGRRSKVVDENTAVQEVVEPVEFDEVDVTEDDGVEEVVASTEGETKGDEKAAKEPAAPKRGDLDEGYVTPVQLAKELSKPLDGNEENLDESNWRYTHSKTGSHVVAPQMVYSYLKSAGKHLEIHNNVVDSNGVSRNNVLKLDEALAWWDGKAERAKERAENAKAKAEKAAAAKAAKDTSSTNPDVAPESLEEAE